MKTRNGFVSNSSVSSFIVKDIEWMGAIKGPYLDDKTRKKLTKYGFKETWVNYPSDLDRFCIVLENENDKIWKVETDDEGKILVRNYGYWVICNQDEVIQFLLKNKISFIASIHYGHSVYLYRKEDDFVMAFANYGSEVEMYHHDSTWGEINERLNLGWKKDKTFYKIPIEEWIHEKKKRVSK